MSTTMCLTEQRACPSCHTMHRIGRWPGRCTQCHGTIPVPYGNGWAVSWALTALVLYVPAIVMLPIITISGQGNQPQEVSVWGTFEKLWSRELRLAAIVVLLCSIVFPAVKSAGLVLVLAAHRVAPWAWMQRLALRTLHVVRSTGKWGMLDVFAAMQLVVIASFTHFLKVEISAAFLPYVIMVFANMMSTESLDYTGLRRAMITNGK